MSKCARSCCTVQNTSYKGYCSAKCWYYASEEHQPEEQYHEGLPNGLKIPKDCTIIRISDTHHDPENGIYNHDNEFNLGD